VTNTFRLHELNLAIWISMKVRLPRGRSIAQRQCNKSIAAEETGAFFSAVVIVFNLFRSKFMSHVRKEVTEEKG